MKVKFCKSLCAPRVSTQVLTKLSSVRPLTSLELREHRASGRRQISQDGIHLVDGVPFGRRPLRNSYARPAIQIPPRQRDVFNSGAGGLEESLPEPEEQLQLQTHHTNPIKAAGSELLRDADLRDDSSDDDDDFEPSADDDDDDDYDLKHDIEQGENEEDEDETQASGQDTPRKSISSTLIPFFVRLL